MKNAGLRLFTNIFSLSLVMVFYGLIHAPLAMSQQTSTQTTTTTSTLLSDNPGLGCGVCTTLGSNFNFNFPDTSKPIFQGNSVVDTLPSSIANGIPIDNQFGAGVPAGSSDFPIHHKNVSSFSEGDFSNTTSEELESTPVSGGGMRHQLTSNINQSVPGGTFNFSSGGFGGGGGDFGSGSNQEFVVLFSISSMTDPDGKLVGEATGTFTQVLDGSRSSGTVRFSTSNGFSGTNLHSSGGFQDGRDFFGGSGGGGGGFGGF